MNLMLSSVLLFDALLPDIPISPGTLWSTLVQRNWTGILKNSRKICRKQDGNLKEFWRVVNGQPGGKIRWNGEGVIQNRFAPRKFMTFHWLHWYGAYLYIHWRWEIYEAYNWIFSHLDPGHIDHLHDHWSSREPPPPPPPRPEKFTFAEEKAFCVKLIHFDAD